MSASSISIPLRNKAHFPLESGPVKFNGQLIKAAAESKEASLASLVSLPSEESFDAAAKCCQ